MMRDAKGRFCKKGSNKNTQTKKARFEGSCEDVDWGSEKECCCKKIAKTSKKDREENTELLKSVMELLLDIGESMARTKDNPETLEEMQETINRTLKELTALKVACETLQQLAEEAAPEKHKGKCKGHPKGMCCKNKELPEEILELADDLGIPIEDIKAAGMIDLDTGKHHVYKGR